MPLARLALMIVRDRPWHVDFTRTDVSTGITPSGEMPMQGPCVALVNSGQLVHPISGQ